MHCSYFVLHISDAAICISELPLGCSVRSGGRQNFFFSSSTSQNRDKKKFFVDLFCILYFFLN